MNKWIWLDMDGTIADLYSVEGWLEDLRAYNTRPYTVAKKIYKSIDLIEILLSLKENGYNIGIISWGSKNSNPDYDKAVTVAKKKWLARNFLDIAIDEILVTPYGVCKADTCREYGYGILVDDEIQNLNAWDLGLTINAKKNILVELAKLL